MSASGWEPEKPPRPHLGLPKDNKAASEEQSEASAERGSAGCYPWLPAPRFLCHREPRRARNFSAKAHCDILPQADVGQEGRGGGRWKFTLSLRGPHLCPRGGH